MIKWSLVHPGSVSCTIASTCSAPMEIPEPRSLSLVGTGFLAMAGLIRRLRHAERSDSHDPELTSRTNRQEKN